MYKWSRIVGERVRVLRKQKGLSQEKLALRAGLAVSYIGQIERGEKSPTVDTLGKIAKTLDVNIALLFEEKPCEEQLAIESPNHAYAEKIAFELSDFTDQEQEAMYRLIRQLIEFKDLSRRIDHDS